MPLGKMARPVTVGNFFLCTDRKTVHRRTRWGLKAEHDRDANMSEVWRRIVGGRPRRSLLQMPRRIRLRSSGVAGLRSRPRKSELIAAAGAAGESGRAD